MDKSKPLNGQLCFHSRLLDSSDPPGSTDEPQLFLSWGCSSSTRCTRRARPLSSRTSPLCAMGRSVGSLSRSPVLLRRHSPLECAEIVKANLTAVLLAVVTALLSIACFPRLDLVHSRLGSTRSPAAGDRDRSPTAAYGLGTLPGSCSSVASSTGFGQSPVSTLWTSSFSSCTSPTTSASSLASSRSSPVAPGCRSRWWHRRSGCVLNTSARTSSFWRSRWECSATLQHQQIAPHPGCHVERSLWGVLLDRDRQRRTGRRSGGSIRPGLASCHDHPCRKEAVGPVSEPGRRARRGADAVGSSRAQPDFRVKPRSRLASCNGMCRSA